MVVLAGGAQRGSSSSLRAVRGRRGRGRGVSCAAGIGGWAGAGGGTEPAAGWAFSWSLL